MSEQGEKKLLNLFKWGKNIAPIMCCRNVINNLIKVSFRLYAKQTGCIFTRVVWVCSWNPCNIIFFMLTLGILWKWNAEFCALTIVFMMVGARRDWILTLNRNKCISESSNVSTKLWRDLRMTFYAWWKRGGRIKKDLSLFCRTSNHRKFHIIFSTWTVDHNTLANRHEMERGVVRREIHLSWEMFADY